jgi:predicted DNA binding CopG/RHH family protein
VEIKFGTVIYDEKLKNISVDGDVVHFYDEYSTRTRIPIKILAHLYEIAKFDKERQGINFEEYVNSLFSKEEKNV